MELFTPEVFCQKLDYFHNNPVRAGLVVPFVGDKTAAPVGWSCGSLKFENSGRG